MFSDGGNFLLAVRIQQNDQERGALWTNTRRVDGAYHVEREGTTQ